MTTITVEASQLTRIYGGRQAVSDVSFTLSQGEVLGFLGPNGAGKSTTMKMLTGNLAPSMGSIKICGIDVIEKPKEAKALIGYLPEQPPLYRELTVDEYLAVAARLHRISSRHIKKAVETAKERCGLTEMSKRLIENLSKGYQQRVGIAQAIIHRPPVVILDEPTVGLDPIQIREIRALIAELGKSHSVILSSHILPEIQAVCDRVMIIARGRVVFNEPLLAGDEQASIIVGLKRPPPLEALTAIAGIEAASVLGNGPDHGRFLITALRGTDPREALALAAAGGGWGLVELHAQQRTLEEIFVELTSGDLRAAA